MTSRAEFQGRVDQSITNFDILDQLANGGPDTDVPTRQGLVPTFSKLQRQNRLTNTAAAASATAADLAAAGAAAASRYFATRSAGEAASSADQFFSTDDGAGNLIYYRRTSGGSVEVGRALTPASIGASDGASRVGFRQAGTGAVTRDTQTKLRETVSVLDFYQPTDANFTPAFNRAVATGKAVFVPKLDGGYPVNGIAVVPNMEIVGEKVGECLGPELYVDTNGGSLFLQQPTSEKVIPHLVFRNLVWRAGDGVTGASGFRSTDQTDYSGYVLFDSIETHRSLVWGYDALFIYTTWNECRDGYLPGIGTFTQAHGFIKSEGANFGQANATNTNNVNRCKVFRGFGHDASVQLAHGDTWTFTGTRWENMDIPAIRARGIHNLTLNYPRAEGSRMSTFLVLQDMSNAGVGSNAVMRDGLFAIDTPNFTAVSADAVSKVSIENNEFVILPPNSRLCDNAPALTANLNNRMSGAGAGDFMTGMRQDRRLGGQTLLNGAGPNGNPSLTWLNNGGSAATNGFASGLTPVSVGADWVTIFTPAASVGLVAVAGIQNSTGTQHAWAVLHTDSIASEVGARIAPGGVVAEFRRQPGALQMRCTSGAAMVTASALVAGGF